MKNMKVIKRDKTLEVFQFSKIKNAIQKAFDSVNMTVDDNVLECMKEKYSDYEDENINVETIQDDIEECLMNNNPTVARSFIIYRYKHKMLREEQTALEKDITKKLTAENIENQNANVDEQSFGGRMGEACRVVTKNDALKNHMSRKSRRNHLNNEIYIHDLDSYSVGEHNCITLPLDDLLKNGFKTRQTDVRPANSINTAFQLVAVLFQIQSLQQFGGVSASHLDWTMMPYVRKSFYKHYKDALEFINNDLEGIKGYKDTLSIDDEAYHKNHRCYEYAIRMTEKELKQAVEGMYHNLNTLQSRSGNQLPFSSINYGTCTTTEGRMVIKALLEGSINGVGKFHKTPIFPCGIFQCMKGVNRDKSDINYDMFKLALKSTSQRLYPNYVNVDWSNNKGYDKSDPRTYMSTMGCRTTNGYDINGFGQLKDGRGNICPVTIILPTLAMEADRDIDKFFKILDKKIFEAKDMLIERFDWICSQSPESAKFMWENDVMKGYIQEEGIRSAMKHGTVVIGQLGLAETLQILIGKDHTTSEGMELAKKIEELFLKRCNEFKETYKLNFGVYYTPAENLCYTALKKFRSKYGIIKNVSDKEFFTNSMHVPVWKKLSPFEKIDIESQLTGYSNAGCITYVELPSTTKNNIEALETIVNYAMDKDIPYFAINIPNDTCENCGYTDEINDTCPMCGSNHISRLRRVTGYLTGNYTTAFNEGKQDEVKYRVKHKQEIL